MAELIAVGSTEASAEFTLANGERATLFIKPATAGVNPVGAKYRISHKTPSSTYVPFIEMTGGEQPLNINGNGTYQVTRLATGVSSGMDNG